MKIQDFIEARDTIKEIRFILANTNQVNDPYQQGLLIEKLDRVLVFIERLFNKLV